MSKDFSKKPSGTDWNRLDAMRDEEIDFSDDPEATPEMFARAIVRKGLKPVPTKEQVTLRLDADVLDWFKAQGKGYQTRINTLLRAYKDACESKQ
ncbi:MAG: BrnA antitoxin family protein [Gammaproteobacteria bacterium]|nr:BrnA antitoxin family protein [Gammaproteobacteria bacterium]